MHDNETVNGKQPNQPKNRRNQFKPSNLNGRAYLANITNEPE